MKDYYKTLGIDKGASKDDIKKAFRKIAHEQHPDKNKGNNEAEKKFKEASEAYSVLSDDNKRKQYDMFGSAGAGFNPNAGGYGASQGFGGFDFGKGFSGFQGFGNGQEGIHFDFSNFGGGQGVEFDLGDIIGDFFGGGRRRPRKGKNITIDLEISFKDSIFGVEKEVSVGGRKEKLLVKIPSGIESGQRLRVAGKGELGEGGPGDLIVRIWVTEHPAIRKEGFHLVMDLSVKLSAALLGGTVELETLDGKIELKIPQGTTHGEIMRVKGKGVPYGGGKRGDLLVVTHINMPKKLSREAEEAIGKLKDEGL